MRRSAALLETRASARDARCAQDVPSRNDRTLPRQPSGSCSVVRACAAAQPAVLAPLGAGGEEVRVVKKKLLLVTCLVTLCHLAWTTVASAHPLGNFTINRFSRIEVSGQRLYVVYVLDLAEIPTFQAGTIDPRAYARRIGHGVSLTLDGRAAPAIPVATALAHPLGAGGLHTTRLEVLLRGPRLAHPSAVTYRDGNYSNRIGWKEIVVGAKTHSI